MSAGHGPRTGAYRLRVALEWRAAVAVAAVAVTGTVLGLLPLQDAWLQDVWLQDVWLQDVWLLGGFGVIVVIALGLLVLAWTRPVPLPSVMPKRFSYRDATTAAGRVRRGEPVDPPELQAAAIDHTRRGLRTSLLTMSWLPVLGATWALRIGDGGFFTGLGYAGLAVMLLGISGLGWSGIVQARLDRLEDSGESSDSTADEHHPGG